MSRDHILHRIRTAIGRGAGQPTPDPPPVRLRVPQKTHPAGPGTHAAELEARVASFRARLEELAGETYLAAGMDEARAFVAAAIEGKSAVASGASYLAACGISSLPGVRSGVADREELRALCASADFGITSAEYALADTGTLVTFSNSREARLVSLLPPAHIAVLPRERMLSGLDELFTLHPHPSSETSAMVLITGPSRTADIEQILVRGVHGPGRVVVVLVG
jgi:L-lactate dehydrogenase complex protein LldG